MPAGQKMPPEMRGALFKNAWFLPHFVFRGRWPDFCFKMGEQNASGLPLAPEKGIQRAKSIDQKHFSYTSLFGSSGRRLSCSEMESF